MDKNKLSAREQALLTEARREAAARTRSTGAQPEAKPAPSSAERLAQLMADERAETQQRKEKMRRYGIGISAAILALFALWVLRASRPRR
jgi:hypothetical protein